MKFALTSIMALAFAGQSYAFVAALYSDGNCQNQIGERNVWDNTCASLDQGIGSFMVTTPGGGGQYGRAFSANNCASVNPTTCVGVGPPGGTLNQCIGLGNSQSNALGSSAINC